MFGYLRKSPVAISIGYTKGYNSEYYPCYVQRFAMGQTCFLYRIVLVIYTTMETAPSHRVISIDHNKDSGDVMFEILYNDGDREDVDFEELDSLVQAYAKKIFLKSQTVGANPQVQSRLGLKEHMEPVNSKCMCSPTEAKRAISEARRKDQIMVFNEITRKLLGPKAIGDMNIIKLFHALMISILYVKPKLHFMASVRSEIG